MNIVIRVLLVLILLAIGLSILPPHQGGPAGARLLASKADIANFTTAIKRFRADCGYYPTTPLLFPAPGLGGAEGTGVLTKRPATIRESVWRGPYLDASSPRNDPWGRPYVYECPGKHNPDGFDVYSLGPNGKGGDEAIGNWTPVKSR